MKNGDFVVVQRADNRLILFNGKGQQVGAVGRSGEGPWEFRSMGSAGRVGDTIWVSDPALGRITYFGPRLEPIARRPLPRTVLGSTSSGAGQEYHLDGLTSGIGSVGKAVAARVGAPSGNTRVDGTIAVVGSDGAFIRTIVERVPDTCYIPFGQFGGTRKLLCVDADWSLSPDGEFFAYAEVGSKDTVKILTSTIRSKTSSRFAVRRTPRPVPRATGDSLLERRMRGAPPQLRAQLATLEAPRWYPPFRRVLAGLDQTVWLQVADASAPHEEWVGIDVRGRTIGELSLPGGVVLHAISTAQAWTSSEDSAGVIRLVRYRIVPQRR